MTNTVLIKRSGVANSIPVTGNLSLGELALNYNDGNLFYKNSSGTVTVIASNKFSSVTGNVTGGNILTGGVVSATGNITGNYFIGNGSQLTGISITGTLNSTVDNFTGNGSQVDFVLSTAPSSENLTWINIDGVEQLRTAYSLAGSTITFSSAPASGANVEVTTLAGSIGSNVSIASGTSNVSIGAANANVSVSVGGTSNVAVFATTGEYVTGVISASGNVSSGGNLLVTNSVGIGTTSPAAPLHVGPTGTGAINGYTKFIVNSTDYAVTTLKSPAANFSQIIFTDPTSTNLGGINFFNSSYATPNAMAFLTGGGNERLRIDANGNVGIGTTTPGATLDVTGSIRASVNITSAADFIGGGAAGYAALYANSTGGIIICRGSSSTNDIEFYTNNAERMRVDSSGNLGIGTTTPVRKLTVSSAGSCEFVLQDTSQAANSRNWRLFNTSNTLYFGTLNDAGTSGTDVMQLTSGAYLQFNSGYGSVATAYGCRAWCQYNQSPSIIGSGNITSITVVGTGDVRLNFATALVDANYAAVATTNESGGQPKWCNSTQPSTVNVRIVTFNANQSTGWFEYNSVAIFR